MKANSLKSQTVFPQLLFESVVFSDAMFVAQDT